MKFRKKPVEIEAVQWTGDNIDEIKKFCSKCLFFIPDNPESNIVLYIRTLEGKMKSNIGDWIIKGVRGEFYPCKEDIFYKTYEKV